jgi:hypothetical protein
MLSSTVVEQNIDFAISLVETGTSLLPKQGSLLEQLVTASMPAHDYTEISKENLCQLIAATTSNEGEEPSPHSAVNDSAVDMLSSLVTAHIKVAKETVLPIVRDVTDKVVSFSNNLNMYDAASDITIKMHKRPVVMDDGELLEELSNYAGHSKTVPTPITLDFKTKDEIILMAMTGSKRLDNDIVEHLSNVDAGQLVRIYNAFFNTGNADTGILDLVGSNPYELFTTALVGYLVARRLFDDVPESAKGLNLTTYQSTIGDIRNYCGAMILDAIERIATADRSGQLILGLDRKNRIINVNDVLYKKWLETNTADAILGSLISERLYSTIEMLENKKDQLVQQWNNYRTYLTLRRNQENQISLKNFMVNVIYSDLSNGSVVTDIEEDFMKTHTSHIETTKKLAEEFVENLSANDMDNLSEVCLALVTKARFYFTSAYEILNGMLEVEKVNKDINPREAALISVLYYITDYFIEQVKETKTQ